MSGQFYYQTTVATTSGTNTWTFAGATGFNPLSGLANQGHSGLTNAGATTGTLNNTAYNQTPYNFSTNLGVGNVINAVAAAAAVAVATKKGLKKMRAPKYTGQSRSEMKREKAEDEAAWEKAQEQTFFEPDDVSLSYRPPVEVPKAPLSKKTNKFRSFTKFLGLSKPDKPILITVQLFIDATTQITEIQLMVNQDDNLRDVKACIEKRTQLPIGDQKLAIATAPFQPEESAPIDFQTKHNQVLQLRSCNQSYRQYCEQMNAGFKILVRLNLEKFFPDEASWPAILEAFNELANNLRQMRSHFNNAVEVFANGELRVKAFEWRKCSDLVISHLAGMTNELNDQRTAEHHAIELDSVKRKLRSKYEKKGKQHSMRLNGPNPLLLLQEEIKQSATKQSANKHHQMILQKPGLPGGSAKKKTENEDQMNVQQQFGDDEDEDQIIILSQSVSELSTNSPRREAYSQFEEDEENANAFNDAPNDDDHPITLYQAPEKPQKTRVFGQLDGVNPSNPTMNTSNSAFDRSTPGRSSIKRHSSIHDSVSDRARRPSGNQTNSFSQFSSSPAVPAHLSSTSTTDRDQLPCLNPRELLLPLPSQHQQRLRALGYEAYFDPPGDGNCLIHNVRENLYGNIGYAVVDQIRFTTASDLFNRYAERLDEFGASQLYSEIVGDEELCQIIDRYSGIEDKNERLLRILEDYCNSLGSQRRHYFGVSDARQRSPAPANPKETAIRTGRLMQRMQSVVTRNFTLERQVPEYPAGEEGAEMSAAGEVEPGETGGLKCEQCPDSRFSCSTNFKQHMEKHSGIMHQCPHFPSQRNRLKNLKAHIKTKHGKPAFDTFIANQVDGNSTSVKEKPFACPVDGCGKSYTRRSGLTNHLNTHYQEPASDEESESGEQ